MAFIEDVRSEATAIDPLTRLRQLAAAHVRWRLEHPAIAEVFDLEIGVQRARQPAPRRAPPPGPRDQADVHRRAPRRSSRTAAAQRDVRLRGRARHRVRDRHALRLGAHVVRPGRRPDRRRGLRDVRRLRHRAWSRRRCAPPCRASARIVAGHARRRRGAPSSAAAPRSRRSPIRRSCRSASARTIAAAIRDHQVVVVAGETGSGKTTQLPKICLELGRGVERHDRPHAAAPARRAHGRGADRARARRPARRGGRVRRPLQRPQPRRHADAADDRRPAARARSAATGCCAATTR